MARNVISEHVLVMPGERPLDRDVPSVKSPQPSHRRIVGPCN